jgi:bifunctional non-homologous end joining protein LigD
VSERLQVERSVGRRQISISNPDKVLYPSAGFTKEQVVDYYEHISEVLVAHLESRALTLRRFPDGVDHPSFVEKNCPSHRPDWVATVLVPKGRRGSEELTYCMVNDTATLVWLANLAALELHPLLSRREDLASPSYLVFDLDPGPPADLVDCGEVARWIRELLDRLGLDSVVKTSGGKGLQLYVPLERGHSFAETKSFARAVAALMSERHPDRVVDRQTKSIRRGKVLIDWSQNDAYKSTVSVYSLRGTARPRVSTPVTWEELDHALDRREPELLVFEPDDVVSRVATRGDLFSRALGGSQVLPKLDGSSGSDRP